MIDCYIKSHFIISLRQEHIQLMYFQLVNVSLTFAYRRVHKPLSRNTMTFTEMAEEFQSENMRSAGLSFDPRDFKARKEVGIAELPTIL